LLDGLLLCELMMCGWLVGCVGRLHRGLPCPPLRLLGVLTRGLLDRLSSRLWDGMTGLAVGQGSVEPWARCGGRYAVRGLLIGTGGGCAVVVQWLWLWLCCGCVVLWLCGGCAVAVLWPCCGCAVAVLWLCCGRAVAVLWLCGGCTVAVQSLCGGCAVAAST
jgi:hypothetical protein